MRYFIGIAPPEKRSEEILKFQMSWKENQFPQWVEPHITVKAQGGLDESMTWLDEVARVAQETTPFWLRLGPPQTFGSDVVFLSVESPELVALHSRLVDAINPSALLRQMYFERPGEFIPHLTLGTTACGLTEKSVEEIKEQAIRIASSEPFEAQFIRLYRQDHEEAKYLPVKDIRLGE